MVKEAGFPNHSFVIAPFYYQNLLGALAPQKQADGTMGWTLPLDADARCIHMGDIRELGNIVAGAFAHPDEAGDGEYLPLVGDFMSFDEIVVGDPADFPRARIRWSWNVHANPSRIYS
jgi:hypothetical protein